MTKIPPQPPIAAKIPLHLEHHGDVRIDNYFWMREKTNPDVIAHLEKENAYTASMLADVEPLRQRLFQELKGRIKEDDQTVPARLGDWYYYRRMEPGRQYHVHCRKPRDLDAEEQIILDCNALAEGKDFFNLSAFSVSPNHEWLAYAVDLDGSEVLTIHFKNLKTGQESPETIHGTDRSLVWAADNRTLFYTVLDQHHRPDRVFRHALGTSSDSDVEIYKEHDSKHFVSLSKSLDERYLFIESHGKITSEIYFLDARTPEATFQIIEPRRRGTEYAVAHHGGLFYIVTNDRISNFRLVMAPVTAPQAANWTERLSGSPELLIEGAELFESHLVITQRAKGLPQLRIIELKSGEEHLIEFPEPAYAVQLGENPEFKTETLRLVYSSLITPSTVIDYDMRTRTRAIKKTQEIPTGYDPRLYRSERVFARAPDGAEVPISLVYRLDANGEFKHDGSHPVYLTGYGSYGANYPASFISNRLSLLDRGFICAIAHIRGGGDLGRHWYENGKFLQKKNTFTDFIAAAEHLIACGYTRAGDIAISGRSAGGMLIGATVNLAPHLFRAAIAHVPFVDVVNTILDDTLPLTTLEFEEWGNPADPVYYHYMKSYSPYDNVESKSYPHLFVTAGLNDPRVTYWEPAKWVAKLRELKTDQNLLLQHITMGAGHGGPSGRYGALEITALEYTFLLKVFERA
jgi:oligopeptidase B